MAGWEPRDYAILFRDHPPTQATAPTADECDALGLRLGRSRGAVKAQWQDARDMALGTANDGSEQLRDYLRGRGWLTTRG